MLCEEFNLCYDTQWKAMIVHKERILERVDPSKS